MASINKSELTKEVASKTDLKQKDADAVIDALVETIKDDLSKGNKVQIIGFGSFEVRNRAARKGRNPQTGKALTIPATKVPAFKPGKALKDAVKQFFNKFNNKKPASIKFNTCWFLFCLKIIYLL